MVAGVGRALDAIEAFRFDRHRARAAPASSGSSTSATLDWLADYRFTGDVWGYPEGEIYFPYSPLLVVESTLRRGGAARDGAALDLQPRLGDRLGRLPDDLGGRRAARASRWARVVPTSRPRSRPRGRRTSPASPPPPTSAPGWSTASRPPAPARTRFTLLHDTEADAFRAQVQLARQGHDAAGRHLRHRRGRAPRRRDRRARPRRGADRLRRPRRSSPTGCAPSSTSSARPRPASSSPPTSTSSRSPGLAAAPVDGYGVGTAAGHRQRPPDLRLRLQAGRPRGLRPARWSRSPRRARTRSRSAAASTPCAGSPPTASPRPR